MYAIRSYFSLEWLERNGINDILAPRMVGSFLCGAISASLSYLLVLWVWRWRVIRNNFV